MRGFRAKFLAPPVTEITRLGVFRCQCWVSSSYRISASVSQDNRIYCGKRERVTERACVLLTPGDPQAYLLWDPAKESPHGEVDREQQSGGMWVPPKSPPSQLEDLGLYPKDTCAVFSAEQTWVGFR